ncbi:hypothetical protein ATH84_10097 [Paracoccus versutus]|uniref:Uncharacterized protein n=1 Tax=Paracoccus versutus TaxID=34007 RepID=A0AAQ0HKQ5_PARVE|nr:hypothetical protein ATH84_10097 [Paracoccus versutus]
MEVERYPRRAGGTVRHVRQPARALSPGSSTARRASGKAEPVPARAARAAWGRAAGSLGRSVRAQPGGVPAFRPLVAPRKAVRRQRDRPDQEMRPRRPGPPNPRQDRHPAAGSGTPSMPWSSGSSGREMRSVQRMPALAGSTRSMLAASMCPDSSSVPVRMERAPRRADCLKVRPGQSGTKSPARSPQASAGATARAGSHAAGPRSGWRGHATSRKGGTAAPPARGPVAAATCASERRAPAGNRGRERCGRCPAARHRPRAQPMRRGCGWRRRRRRRTRPSEDIHHSPLPTSRPPARKSPRSTRNPCGSSRTAPPQLEFLVIPLEVAEDVDHAQAYRKAGAPARLLHGSIKHSDRRWTMIASSLAKGIGP